MPLSNIALLASSLLTLTSAEVQVCASVARPPQVEVRVTDRPPEYDDSLKSAKLLRLDLGDDNIAAISGHDPRMLGGLTHNRITINHRIAFRRASDRRSGFGCIWFDKIEITIGLAPVVYIAREYARNKCRRREIIDHEKKHVEADRRLAARYERLMEDGVEMVFGDPADYRSGVIVAKDIPKARKKMLGVVENALGTLHEKMQAERMALHRSIDTPEEYGRLARTCKN